VRAEEGDVLLSTADPRRVLEIVPPEGVALPFRVATAGERLAAHLVDLVCQIALLAILMLCIFLAGGGRGQGWLGALFLILVFVVMNGYFLWYELGPRGATPGKRWYGLRVMAAHGGVLTPGAVAARNLMRNLEFNVPLALFLDPSHLGVGTSFWVRLLLIAWAFVLAGLPLFNRHRLRLGDLVGGTIVVVAPRPGLLGELTRPVPARQEEAYAFTPAHLGVYGVYELQVLEDVLRRSGSRAEPGDHEAIAAKIVKKIGWPGTVKRAEAQRFLLAFYAAQRRHLEERMLLGKRKQDKRSRER
jgi:uncharacterized RDD family membrane protein YckC